MALAACESLPKAHLGLTVVPEFAGPLGVPDFTAFVGSPQFLLDRQSAGIAPVLNEIDAGLVTASGSSVARSLDDIASRLGWPTSSLLRRLPGLLRSGAMQHVGAGRFIHNPALAARGRIYAVEAKVEDWTAALRQVRAYRTWADGYVIVTGPLSETVVERFLPEVQRDRGGLIVDGMWLSRPRIGPVAPHKRLLAFEALAAATFGPGLDLPTFAGAESTKALL